MILSLAAVFSLFGFEATQAWFSDGDVKSQILESGGLQFTATGSFALEEENPLVLPGAKLKLKDTITITNTSSIDSEIRIKIECTYDGATEAFPWASYYLTDADSKWKAEEDGYIYYYPNGVVESEDPEVISAARRIEAPELTETTTAAETTTSEAAVVNEETTKSMALNDIEFIGGIKISGEVPYELQNKQMKISFKIQAKQADFADWQNFQ